MLHSKSRWIVGRPDEAAARMLAEELRIDHLTARLLVVRGINSIDQARLFMQANSDHFYDPFLLAGMRKAVDRIRAAVDKGEMIRVYGDYDADGVSSTSLMIRLLRMMEANFDYYIPHRVNEGYGLNRGALDDARACGVSLIVTVDTGISAREQVAYAAGLGMDVIVTDHHEPPELLPDAAYAIVNPKIPGCPYPFKQLAGAGVAFKLAHALLGRVPEELAELAAIGTIADLMPLQDENRLLAKLGLERMRVTANPGIRALAAVSGVERGALTATHIGFALAPRINASGRLEAADTAVRLLTTGDAQEAERLAAGLDVLNLERQRIVEEITRDALEQAELSLAAGNGRVLVLAGVDWNVGVVGIVASKVLERFYRPAIVLSVNRETGKAKGSARSIAGFDIYRALAGCADLLDHFGGHQAAAGMTLSEDLIGALRDRLQEIAAERLTEADLVPIRNADLECGLEEISLPAIRGLEKLEPFGMGNPSPRFVIRNLKIADKKTMGKDKQHLKLLLSNPGGEGQEVGASAPLEAVGFGSGELADRISATARVDVLGELSVNEWNGTSRPQLVIRDLSIPNVQVFDWRGTRDMRGVWSRLLEGPGIAGIAAFTDVDAAEAVRMLENSLAHDNGLVSETSGPAVGAHVPVWAFVSPEAVPVPANEAASAARFSAVTELLLYSQPDTLEQLAGALGRAAAAERIYAWFMERRSARETALPTRDMFKQVYTVLRHPAQAVSGKPAEALHYFSKRSGLSVTMVQFILEVFEEVELVEKTSGGGYRCLEAAAKKDLTQSSRYHGRMRHREVEQLLVYSTSEQLTDWIKAKLPDHRGN